MLKLKEVLAGVSKTQADLARAVDLSPAAIAQLINHGLWPKSSTNLACLARSRTFYTSTARTMTTSRCWKKRWSPGAPTPRPLQPRKRSRKRGVRPHGNEQTGTATSDEEGFRHPS